MSRQTRKTDRPEQENCWKASRRTFLRSSAQALLVAASGCTHAVPSPRRTLVNDVQSRLNATFVEQVLAPRSLSQLQSVVQQAAARGKPLSICGGRHAMGGQQFRTDGILLDTTGLNRVLKFNRELGTLEVEAGIQWPALLRYLLSKQRDPQHTWTFAQKQTGANRFCLGGALGSNIHSRGLTMKPFMACAGNKSWTHKTSSKATGIGTIAPRLFERHENTTPGTSLT